MKPLRDISIRHKQTLIILLTSGVALLLACAAFVIYDLAIFRREMVERMSSLAEVVGNNSTGALDFNDPKSAQESLAALRGEPTVASACIYDKEGLPFATYTRADSLVMTAPPVQTSSHEFADEHLLLFRTIKQGDETIGTIYIASSLDEFTERVTGYVGIVTVFLPGSLLVALVLSSRLQRVISRPILHLAEVARSVALEKNYSVRAKKHSEDELGKLVDGFNEMLAEIQERDFALQAARDTLEHSVRERTAALRQEIAERQRSEQALRESHQRFEIVSRTTSDVIWDWDLANHALWWNENFQTVFGYLPAEIGGGAESWTSRIHPEDAPAILDSLHVAFERGEHLWSGEYRFRRRDGDYAVVFDRGQILRDEQGQSVRMIGAMQDITDRKRAEEVLRQTEELYRQAIAGADAVPYSYRYETKSYVFMGAGIKQLIGYAPEEMVPALWQGIIKESVMLGETAGLAKAEAARRVARGELLQWRCDMRVVTRDGKSRWISDSSVQEVDASGKLVGSVGILQDITERKQAEITATAFSKLGRDLSCATSGEAAAHVIGEVADELFGWDACSIQVYSRSDDTVRCIFEADTFEGKRVESANHSHRKITALHHRIFKSGAELILRDIATFLPEATPFGNRSRPSASLMYVPIRTAHEIVGIMSIQSYSPNAYTEQNLATLQTLADQCSGALERIRADEARRKSESQFRLVWDTSADGMRLASQDGTVLEVNDAYCRMVEKTKAELEGQPLTVVHCAANAKRVMQGHQERMDSGVAQTHLETEVTLWNGRKVWFELSNSILNLPGQPGLLLSIFRNITGRKAAEAELGSMHRQLLGVSRQAGMAEVATSVLHNVGNVLNSVNTSASILADRLRTSRVSGVSRVTELLETNRHDLAGFLTANGRADQVINFLKTLSQHLTAENAGALEELQGLNGNIEHIKEIVAMQQSYARISGVTEKVKPTDLVEDALRMNVGALARHQVKLVRDYAPEVPEIMVEKHKVLQILVNLIRNAKYACDDSNSSDKCLTLRVTNGGDRVCIAVVDNGVGIPFENLTRIFSHGFTTRKTGHGFGLHSGALAARELGGSLIAHSEGPGLGATFTLELPAQPASAHGNCSHSEP